MLRALLGLSGLPILGLGEAASRDIRVVTPPDPGTQRLVLQALKSHYPGSLFDVDPASLDLRHGTSPVVALGPAALRRTLELDFRAPLISALTSSQAYKRLLAASGRDPTSCTALFAEASPAAQMQLIAAIFERKVTVGALLSDASSYLEKPLRQAAIQAGLELQLARIENGQDPVRAINALSGTHVLLAVADSTLYTPDTLRSILESTYRRGLPVIGFSAATVTAGTLASAWSDPEDLAADLIELIDSLNANALPEARHPRYWRVTINDNVARSLGLSISDKVRAMGTRPAGRTG
ncbi:MAG: hypothetical protein EPO09_18335 [Aquabacterium sp.]|uniref:hypothetical protein n=1 Tax=Aquabacterium sp. TaxID=1872578 RepID=UPI0011F7EBE3|nr:hypothetical protein [Aquabacterium sp.]TAK87878.1 MAG: hypothetical protein EPO09_18335 [Aquabacterium sp.]